MPRLQCRGRKPASLGDETGFIEREENALLVGLCYQKPSDYTVPTRCPCSVSMNALSKISMDWGDPDELRVVLGDWNGKMARELGISSKASVQIDR